jgi:hypothetical protein
MPHRAAGWTPPLGQRMATPGWSTPRTSSPICGTPRRPNLTVAFFKPPPPRLLPHSQIHRGAGMLDLPVYISIRSTARHHGRHAVALPDVAMAHTSRRHRCLSCRRCWCTSPLGDWKAKGLVSPFISSFKDSISCVHVKSVESNDWIYTSVLSLIHSRW